MSVQDQRLQLIVTWYKAVTSHGVDPKRLPTPADLRVCAQNGSEWLAGQIQHAELLTIWKGVVLDLLWLAENNREDRYSKDPQQFFTPYPNSRLQHLAEIQFRAAQQASKGWLNDAPPPATAPQPQPPAPQPQPPAPPAPAPAQPAEPVKKQEPVEAAKPTQKSAPAPEKDDAAPAVADNASEETKSKADEYRKIFEDWRQFAIEKGIDGVPESITLSAIAERGRAVFDGRISPAMEKWKDLLKSLMDLVDNGETDKFYDNPNRWLGEDDTVDAELVDDDSSSASDDSGDMRDIPLADRYGKILHDWATAAVALGMKDIPQTLTLNIIAGRGRAAFDGRLPVAVERRKSQIFELMDLVDNGETDKFYDDPQAWVRARLADELDTDDVEEENPDVEDAQAEEDAAAEQGEAELTLESATTPEELLELGFDVVKAAEEPKVLSHRLKRTHFRKLSGFDAASLQPLEVLTGACNADGTVALMWEEPEDSYTHHIYRVVFNNDEICREDDPESGELMAITTGLRWVDQVPSSLAFRHYHVWVNSGDSEKDALTATPQLLGSYALVNNVSGLTVALVEGKLTASWSTYGTAILGDSDSLEIYVADENSLELESPRNMAGTTATRNGTFAYAGGAGSLRNGAVYRVAVRRLVAVGGESLQSILSEPVEVKVNLPLEPVEIRVSPVQKLTASPFSTGDTTSGDFEISFDRPQVGDVILFGSSHFMKEHTLCGPNATTMDFEEAKREINGYEIPKRLTSSGSWSLSWRGEDTEMHIYPVTVEGSQARIGTPQSVYRVMDFTNARIVYRGDTVMLEFAWPQGADNVSARYRQYIPETGEFEQERAVTTTDRETYTKLGVLTVPLSQLPGCGEIILTATRIKQQDLSTRTVLTYVGMYQLQARIITRSDNPEIAGVFLEEVPDQATSRAGSLRFKVMHHPSRLPLDVSDGQAVELRMPEGGDDAHAYRDAEVQPHEVINRGAYPLRVFNWSKLGRGGYVRLFVEPVRAEWWTINGESGPYVALLEKNPDGLRSPWTPGEER